MGAYFRIYVGKESFSQDSRDKIEDLEHKLLLLQDRKKELREELFSGIEFLRTPDGIVYGWTVGGRIYLTPDGINPDTPVHEYTHLWSSAVENRNPELWSRIVDAMKQSPLWNDVASDEAYRSIWNDDSRMASEVLSRLSGRENYQRAMERAEAEIKSERNPIAVAEKVSAWYRVRRALSDFWNKIKEIFGQYIKKSQRIRKQESWEYFMNSAIGDFYMGVNPNVKNSPMEKMFIGEKGASNLDNAEEDDNLYRSDDAAKNRIEALFNQAISGEFKGRPVSIGTLTDEGKAYLEQISGVAFKDKVDFVLNPSDLVHIYKDHFGNNEKDKGQNIPLDIEDIRSIADVITMPDKVVFFKEGEGSNRNMFYFFKEAENGTYNLMEIYSDRKGNLTAKTFYKTRKDASQRVMDIEKSLLSTSETYFGAILSDAKIPQMFETANVEDNYSREGEGAYTENEVSFENDPIAMVAKVESLAKRLHLDIEVSPRFHSRSGNTSKLDSHSLNRGIVEIVTDASQLEGEKAAAKGFYSKSTGKITIVIPNHTSTADVEQTIMHEAVAHHGLRKLFGEHFNTFLDNVYENADSGVRRRIATLASKHGWDFRKATEEYLASLAEDTEYENMSPSLWMRIKEFFSDMLSRVGIKLERPISDGRLRYILWRSYKNLTSPKNSDPIDTAEDLLYRHTLFIGEESHYTAEERDIIEKAKADGSYMKAPGGKPTNLSPKQWVQVRTKAFKKWFGDWEKAARIEKLKKSKPVEITGNEIEASEDIKQYRDNAKKYGLALRGEYTNADTGNVISLSKGSIKEVTSHDVSNEQLQSVAAIPQIIENSVYIDTVENADKAKHPDVVSYDYYICGLKIDGVDYTVKAVVANSTTGERYYDHRLTQIEKGELISLTTGITTPGNENNSPLSHLKDKRLLSILQTNASKVVDENGEPMVVYHGTGAEFTVFDPKKIRDNKGNMRGFFFTTNRNTSSYYGNEMPVFLNVRNPLREVRPNETNIENAIKDNTIGRYDGTIAYAGDEIISNPYLNKGITEDRIVEIVATNPNQIKSATDNVGTFSTESDDILLRKKESDRRREKNRINNAIDTAIGILYGSKEVAKRLRLKRESERRELAKEIYSSVLKGDFNPLTLEQINKYIEDATPANPFGRRISQRLPQRMERALRQGARTNAVDALFSRISENSVPANGRFSEAGRRAIEERKKELLKGWAIATGNWHTDLKDFTNDTEPVAEGKDSKVYSSKDGRFVIKASRGKPYGKRFRPDIDNIALFNNVFRNTRYEILGYGEIDGEFVRILRQPVVDFAHSTPLTDDERIEYMQSLGFEPLNGSNAAFADGEIVIADLQKGNIVRDNAGNITVIDADAKLHTKDVGGNYTYPPVETDLPEGTDLTDPDDDILLRSGESSEEETPMSARERYDARVKGLRFGLKEGHYNHMESVDILMEEAQRESGEKMESFEDVSKAMNQLSSKNHAMREAYERDFFEPLKEELFDLMRKGSSYEELKRYLFAKSGQERN